MKRENKTGTITLGVPLGVYASYNHKEIKELFISKLNEKLEFTISDKPVKTVYMTVRLPIDKVDKVKYLADFYNVTIIEMTTNILGNY